MAQCSDELLSQVQQKQYDASEKPEGRLCVEKGGFVSHTHHIDADPDMGYVWGTRGHDPDEAIPHPGTIVQGYDAAKHLQARRLAGALKRAWEYPALMKRFANNPREYFEWSGVTDAVASLFTDDVLAAAGSGCAELGKQVGVAVECLQPENASDLNPAARVVLHMFQRVHEIYMPRALDCK